MEQVCAACYNLVQFGVGAGWYRLVQLVADPCRLVQLDEAWCKFVQLGIIWLRLVQVGQIG